MEIKLLVTWTSTNLPPELEGVKVPKSTCPAGKPAALTLAAIAIERTEVARATGINFFI
jgi:hypothetical protein